MSGKQSSHTSREIGAARKNGWSSVRCRCGQTIKSKSVTTRRVKRIIHEVRTSWSKPCPCLVFYINSFSALQSLCNLLWLYKLCKANWSRRRDLNTRPLRPEESCKTPLRHKWLFIAVSTPRQILLSGLISVVSVCSGTVYGQTCGHFSAPTNKKLLNLTLL